MAKIPTAERDKLPAKVFAGPKRSFPLTDKNHDRAAIRDVPKSEKAGNITKGQGDAIKAKAEAKLGKPAEKPQAKADPKPAPKAAPKAAPKLSADDKAIGMHHARHVGGIKGHMTYS